MEPGEAQGGEKAGEDGDMVHKSPPLVAGPRVDGEPESLVSAEQAEAAPRTDGKTEEAVQNDVGDGSAAGGSEIVAEGGEDARNVPEQAVAEAGVNGDRVQEAAEVSLDAGNEQESAGVVVDAVQPETPEEVSNGGDEHEVSRNVEPVSVNVDDAQEVSANPGEVEEAPVVVGDAQEVSQNVDDVAENAGEIEKVSGNVGDAQEVSGNAGSAQESAEADGDKWHEQEVTEGVVNNETVPEEVADGAESGAAESSVQEATEAENGAEAPGIAEVAEQGSKDETPETITANGANDDEGAPQIELQAGTGGGEAGTEAGGEPTLDAQADNSGSQAQRHEDVADALDEERTVSDHGAVSEQRIGDANETQGSDVNVQEPKAIDNSAVEEAQVDDNNQTTPTPVSNAPAVDNGVSETREAGESLESATVKVDGDSDQQTPCAHTEENIPQNESISAKAPDATGEIGPAPDTITSEATDSKVSEEAMTAPKSPVRNEEMPTVAASSPNKASMSGVPTDPSMLASLVADEVLDNAKEIVKNAQEQLNALASAVASDLVDHAKLAVTVVQDVISESFASIQASDKVESKTPEAVEPSKTCEEEPNPEPATVEAVASNAEPPETPPDASALPSETPEKATALPTQKEQSFAKFSDVLHPGAARASGSTVSTTNQPVVKRPGAKSQSEVQTRRFSGQQAAATSTSANKSHPVQQQVQAMQPIQAVQHAQQVQHPGQVLTMGQFAPQQQTMRPGQIAASRMTAPYYNRNMVSQMFRNTRSVMAAPLPELPPAQEIQSLIKSIDAELDALRRELQQLQYIQRRGIITVPKMSEKDPQLAVQDYKGFVISHSMVDDVESVSRQRGAAARSKWRLDNVRHRYACLSHVPHMKTVLENQEVLVEPVYLVVRNWKSVVAEKAYSLTVEYLERRANWVKLCTALSEESKQARILLEQWPPEFAQCVQKTNEAAIKAHVGPDEPMYLDPWEGQSYAFYDMNKFVADPVAEHNAYRKRLVWTEAEVKIFLERYAQHPREFKRISTGLPMKTVKDVIEFYNIHRIDLNLKDIEVASRKRGRKKMISEGVVRK